MTRTISKEFQAWLDSQMRKRNEVQEHQTLTVEKGVKSLRYLYSIGTKFNTRKGPKAIVSIFTNLPVTHKDTKLLRDVYESLGLTKSTSGEFPVPDNLEQYEYYKYCTFNEDCTAFTVESWDHEFFLDEREYDMYVKAYNEYYNKYYIGSEQERMDKQQEMDAEMAYLRDNIHLPDGAYFIESGRRNHILLNVDTFEAYVVLRAFEIYDQWNNASWKQFTFSINKTFSYTLGTGDIEKEKEHLEKNFFSVMDNIDGGDALYYFEKEVFQCTHEPDLIEYIEYSIEKMREKINALIKERDIQLDTVLAKLNGYHDLPDDCYFSREDNSISNEPMFMLHRGSYRSSVHLLLSGAYFDFDSILKEGEKVFHFVMQNDFRYVLKSDDLEEKLEYLRNNIFNVLDEVDKPMVLDFLKERMMDDLWWYSDQDKSLILNYFKEREAHLAA